MVFHSRCLFNVQLGRGSLIANPLVVLLVNNLGSISQLEMGGIVLQATKYLQEKGIAVRRILSGTYIVCPILFVVFHIHD